MKDHRIDGVRRRMGFLNDINVAPIGKAGGLSLWWDDSIVMEGVDSEKHYIDAQCRCKDSQVVFRFTGVYGTSYRAEKAVFWSGMLNDFNPSTIPWICGGDFNEYLWDWEKKGGSESRSNRHRYLDDFMREMKLFDLDFNGPPFTWRGIRNGTLVEERLDRGLINKQWQDYWPNSSLIHGVVLGSDHCPVIVQGEPRGGRGKRLFKFEAFWVRDPECRSIVKNCWESPCAGGNMEKWIRKINDCRSSLSRWSRKKFKYRGQQIKEMMSQLGKLQEN
ncbi:hypothetical protein TB1_039662 [Malus domestica]